MPLPPKEVTCSCGHTTVLAKPSDWCTKCARKVFYEPKDLRKHKLNTWYIYGLMVVIMFFLTYVFLELIVDPFFR